MAEYVRGVTLLLSRVHASLEEDELPPKWDGSGPLENHPLAVGALAIREIVEGPFADTHIVSLLEMAYNHRLVLAAKDDVYGYIRGFCYPKYLNRDDVVHRGFRAWRRVAPGLDAIAMWHGEGDPPGPWIKESGTERRGPGLPEVHQRGYLQRAGCTCDRALLGYRPGVGPRCRLCNTVVDTESGVD